MAIRVPRLTSRSVGSFSNFEEIQVWAREKDEEARQIILSIGDASREISKFSRGSTETTSLGAHASTHLPTGSDPISVGTPTDVGAANSAGTANTLVRSDHVHAGVADLTGGTNINVSAAVGSVTVNLDASISLTDITASSGTPFTLTDPTPDIQFGYASSASSSSLSFTDRNAGAGGAATTYSFSNNDGQALQFTCQGTQISFTTSPLGDNLDLLFTAQGSGDIKFDAQTGDILLDANAAVKWTGAAVCDYAANSAITVGQTSQDGSATTYTIKTTGANNASDITFTMGAFGSAAKIAHTVTGLFAGFAGDDLEIECTLGSLLLNAAATESIVLNDDGADVDFIHKASGGGSLIASDAGASTVTIGGDLLFGDNDEIKWGAGTDGRLYSDGGKMIFNVSVGGLELVGGGLFLIRVDSGRVFTTDSGIGGSTTGTQFLWRASDGTTQVLEVGLSGASGANAYIDGKVGGILILGPTDSSSVQIGKSGGGVTIVPDLTITDAANIVLQTTTGTKIGTATTQKLGFFNATPVVQPAALTSSETGITHTAPGTPDYAIASLTTTTPYGFVSQDEGHTVLQVIANLQTRQDEIESKLQSLGLLA